MKSYVAIVILALVAVTLASDFGNNGQPGCKTEIELKLKYFKNNWNPAQYWVCEELGVPGALATCPAGTGYQNRRQGCIDWEVWSWERPDIIISLPDIIINKPDILANKPEIVISKPDIVISKPDPPK